MLKKDDQKLQAEEGAGATAPALGTTERVLGGQ